MRNHARYRVLPAAWNVVSKESTGAASGVLTVAAPASGFDSLMPPAAVASDTLLHVPWTFASATSDAYMTTSLEPAPLPVPVRNDQIGPAVEPPLFTAVMRQKYVVFAESVPGADDGDESPVAACAGGVDVPNATVYVVPTAPADHVSVGDVPTPVAASDGLGFAGASGGPAAPPVVKDHVSDE